MFLAHEFLDAMPIHRLVKVDKEWREVLVDVNVTNKEEKVQEGENAETKLPFRFILANANTPASSLYTKVGLSPFFVQRRTVYFYYCSVAA